jgi:hypothetical protein
MSRFKKVVIPFFIAGLLGLFTFLEKRNLDNSLRTLDVGPLMNRIATGLAPIVINPILGSHAPRADEKYVYTYTNAAQLSKRLQEPAMKANAPRSTLGLENLDDRIRFDGWGHPFCFVRNEHRLAIFSGGRQGFVSGECDAIRPLEKDIPGLKTGVLNLYPNGILVLVVSDQS